MSDKQYLFGMEAMEPLLKALGLPVDEAEREFVYQELAIDLIHNRYPKLTLTVVPTKAVLTDPDVIKALSAFPVELCIEREGINYADAAENDMRAEEERKSE